MQPIDILKILENKNAAELFKAVCDLYRDVRIIGFTGDDQDMLLYQYGIFDWGQREKFELDLTRQFMSSEGEILQLRSTILFDATAKLRSLQAENMWCNSPAELSGFVRTMQNSTGYLACRSIEPIDIVVEYERV